MAAVPALALAGNWPAAAALLVLERAGRATRNPPRDVMLSHAGAEMGGYGWAFGLHEALDQAGAVTGPLVIAAILARRGDYRLAFGALAIPAAVTLLLLGVARLLYPRPEEMESHPQDVHTEGMPRVFWIYLAGAALVAAGFADFSLIAFHFAKSGSVGRDWIPIFYAVAMGTSGAGSLVFGRLYDRAGLRVLVPLTILSALFAPLVFLGGTGRAGFWIALAGAAIWGVGMGVHESIVPAAVAPMVARGAACVGVRTVHRRLRRLVVSGQRADWRALRRLARRDRGDVRCARMRGDSLLCRRSEANESQALGELNRRIIEAGRRCCRFSARLLGCDAVAWPRLAKGEGGFCEQTRQHRGGNRASDFTCAADYGR